MGANALAIMPPLVNVNGTISSDTTWTLADSPYILTDTVWVNEAVTLTIEPGVVVMGQANATLRISGHLQAIGTTSQPITFTSSANTGAGEWAGLEFHGGTGDLQHTVMRYGSGIWIQGSPTADPVTIADSVIEHNNDYAIMIETDNIHRLALSNVRASNNVTDRVYLHANDWDHAKLAQNTRLTAVPLMDGYEFSSYGLNVPENITLTMDPGVLLMGAENSVLNVNGHLEAIGTVTNPITFTSSANTGAGEWSGVAVSGTANLTHAQIRYGQENLQSYSGTVHLFKSTINHASSNGLSVHDGKVMAACTTFNANSSNAVYINSGNTPAVTLFSSQISGNGNGVNNTNGQSVDARNNWWGDASGPSGDGSGSGDTVLGNVQYKDWLTAPACITFD